MHTMVRSSRPHVSDGELHQGDQLAERQENTQTVAADGGGNGSEDTDGAKRMT